MDTSAGNRAGSVNSKSMTTEVSKSATASSAVNGLVQRLVYVGAEAPGVDGGQVSHPTQRLGGGNRPSPTERAKFSGWHPIARDDERLPRLDRAEHATAVVA